MKTANIGSIAIATPNKHPEKFNLNHDNNTTYDWGSIQPTFGKLMLPDSTLNINAELLTRVAPLVVPTFGRIKIKNIAHFIPCNEIWPNWDAMLSQTKVTRTSAGTSGQPTYNTYVPKTVPYIKSNVLTAMCLIGSRVNLYWSGDVGTAAENSWMCVKNTGTYAEPGDNPAWVNVGRNYLRSLLKIEWSKTPTMKNLTAFNYHGYTMQVAKLTNNDSTMMYGASLTGDGWNGEIPTISTMVEQPMPNSGNQGYTHSANNEANENDPDITQPPITFSGADIIWEFDGENHAGITANDRTAGHVLAGVTSSGLDGKKIRLVFKLSSFGKRLRKVLIGLGYDVNLANNDEVSLLPLMAYYKAWWDTFAPERTRNFYETACWKLINQSMASATATNITESLNTANRTAVHEIFQEFIADLGTCFATEKVDVISAATDSYFGGTNTTTDGNNQTEIQKTIIESINTILGTGTTGYGDTGNLGTQTGAGVNNSATNAGFMSIAQKLKLDTVGDFSYLTQPQIDALKKGYIMMNKTSAAGMAVEQILRALGMGDYIEECKGKFITTSDDVIKISDVVATAATDKAKLGQYGGRGLGLSQYKVSYKTNRHGYFIILSCIVPESGYINSPAHENEAFSFEKMYNPELDGLAYEALQKKQIAGTPLISDPTYKDTFGFVPTYTQWKFMSNKANGDFSLNSRKSYMTPFTLDKYIPIADPNDYRQEIIHDQETGNGSTLIVCAPTFHYSDLPNAGEEYRYVNKYPWNGEYSRIFDAEDDGLEWSVFSPNNNSFLYNSFEFDNFMVHNVFEVTYWAHMKSIEKSYGTYDQEHEAPNATVKRS